MHLGVFTVILGSMPLEPALDYLAGLGVQAVEIGAGAYAGTAHCNVDALLADQAKARAWLEQITSRGLQVSSLSCHGNPLHPNKKIAAAHDLAFRKAVRLASTLEIDVVTTFSGCPGGAPGDKQPNWVTCPWPPDFLDILKYQWDKAVIPYWKKTVAFAKDHGIRKIALEMHPGFVVYNPETLLRLRHAAGNAIGANFDPSHLFWQGMDPCEAVRALKGAIWHVHAKDAAIHEWNSRRNGVLDTKHYKGNQSLLDFPHGRLRQPAPLLVQLRLRPAHERLRRRPLHRARRQPHDYPRRTRKRHSLPPKHPPHRAQRPGHLGITYGVRWLDTAFYSETENHRIALPLRNPSGGQATALQQA